MIQKMKQFFIVECMFIVMFLAFMPGKVYAAGQGCDVMIPVSVEMTGDNISKKTEFKIVLEKTDPNVPLPEEMTGIVKGTGNFSFGPITYTVPGDYHYRIYQKKGSEKNVTYDSSVYEVTVRVVNDEDENLKSELWALKDDSKEKSDAIKFVNTYKESFVSKKTPQTGDQTNKIFLLEMMGISGLVMAAVIFDMRRRKNVK